MDQVREPVAGDASIRTVLAKAADVLAAVGVPTPQADARLLAAHVLACSLGELDVMVALGQRAFLSGQLARFDELLAERSRRVPVQHLTGVAHWRDVTLAVGPGVFIPRPETEVVAQAAIDAHSQPRVIVDLCTGSGAIAIACARAHPQARVYAVERDLGACAWAERNVAHLTPPGRVELVTADVATVVDQGDTTAPDGALAHLVGTVDVVVSNPPYIPDGQVPVDPEVRDHDPQLALFGGGDDGMTVPRLVMATASQLLRPGGHFVMEHADCQQDSVLAALRAGGWQDATGHPDLTGKDRFVTARWPGSV